MEENRNSAISVRNVCIDYKSLKTGSIKENLFKIKKVEQEIFHAVRNVSFEVPEDRFLELPERTAAESQRCSGQLPESFQQTVEKLIFMDIPFPFCQSVLVLKMNCQEERILFYLVCSLDSQETSLWRRCQKS